MSSRQSFQLPDLLAIIAPLELRTNPRCRVVTVASEEWMSSKAKDPANLLSENDLSLLRPAKVGLLAALCFPACDAPQLRLLADFMSLLLYSGIRLHTIGGPSYQLWETPLKVQSADVQGGIDMLRRHALLKHVVDTRISPLADKAPETWNARFRRSVELFHSAHEQVWSNRIKNAVPSLDEYIQIRREMYGFGLAFDLAELLEAFKFPEVQEPGTTLLANLKAAAADVIAWSTDVVAYQLDQSRGNAHCNLVMLLIFHKKLSLQGAMNLSGTMIKEAFASFCSNEQAMLDALNAQKPSPLLSWVWKTMSSEATTSREEGLAAQVDDVKRYIRALKDCIVGSIHWTYETELFFGKKGAEMRTFGWVFVDQVPTLPV